MITLGRLGDQRWTRWAALGLGVVAVVGIAWGGWAAWKSRYEAQGGLALAQARMLLAQSQAPGAPPDTRDRAGKALQAVVEEYPRLSTAAQVAYLLGSMHFSTGQYPQARARTRSQTLGVLAALDIGYCWEAEKNYDAAEKAYQSAILGAGPKDFLYEEAMVDIGRSQELAGKRAAALETYQRLLKELPDTRRADEVRSRVAGLQLAPKP